MLTQILLNAGIGLVWVLLNDNYTIQSFVVGYIIGMATLFVFRNQLDRRLYLFNLYYFVVIFVVFIKEVVKSAFVVVIQVLKPTLTIKPGIVAYHTDLKTPWQILLLTSMITLIPGSVSMEISPDNKIIYIHVFDITQEGAFVKDVKEQLEDRIKEAVRE